MHVYLGHSQNVFKILLCYVLELDSINFLSPDYSDKWTKANFPEPLSDSINSPVLQKLNISLKSNKKVVSTGNFHDFFVRKGLILFRNNLMLHLVDVVELNYIALVPLIDEISIFVAHRHTNQLWTRHFYEPCCICE